MDDERVTVVTVAYRSAATLGIFLDTLERATSRPRQVIVVDNCPADGSVREIVGGRQNIQIIANEANIGYGAAANRGIAQTDTRLVMLANPDVVWDTDSIDVLMTAVTRWPRGAAFGPLIRTPEGTTYPSARRLPSLGAGVGHALLGRLWPNNPWTASYRQQDREPVERTAEWLSGSCLLLVRSSFDAIGGFDPDYFMYFEDVDLGERLAKMVGRASTYQVRQLSTSAARRHRSSPQAWSSHTTAVPGVISRAAIGAGDGWRSGQCSALGWRPARRSQYTSVGASKFPRAVSGSCRLKSS